MTKSLTSLCTLLALAVAVRADTTAPKLDGKYEWIETKKFEEPDDAHDEPPASATIKDGTIKIHYEDVGEQVGHATGTVDDSGKVVATGKLRGKRISVTGQVTCTKKACDVTLDSRLTAKRYSVVVLTTDRDRIAADRADTARIAKKISDKIDAEHPATSSAPAPSRSSTKAAAPHAPAAPSCHPRTGYSCRIGTNGDCHKDEYCAADPRAKPGKAYNGLCTCK